MGRIFTGECTCGYRTKRLFVGCGMEARCFDLAQCTHCRRLTTMERTAPEAHCPRCTHPLRVVPDPRDHPNASYLCPKCKQPRLRLATSGLWD